MLLGEIAKFGPLPRIDFWAGVNSVLEKLMTHLLLSLSLTAWLLLPSLTTFTPWVDLLLLSLWLLAWFGLFLSQRMSNFLTCLALTLLNLSILTFSMKFAHLSGSYCVSMDANLVLFWIPLSSLACIVLFMLLTLFCINCFSAFSIIFLALALMFVWF